MRSNVLLYFTVLNVDISSYLNKTCLLTHHGKVACRARLQTTQTTNAFTSPWRAFQLTCHFGFALERGLAEARFSIISHIVAEILGRVERVFPGHHHLVVGARRQPQHALEGALEVGIAKRIKDGVKRRVDVAEPDGGRVEFGVDAVLAERHHHEEHEVGQPAEHERAHDDAQLPRRLFLLLQNDCVRRAAPASVC